MCVYICSLTVCLHSRSIYTTTPLTFFVFLSNPFQHFYVFISIRVGIGPVGREKDKISSRSGSVATPTTSFQDSLALLNFSCRRCYSFYPNGIRVSIVSVVFAVTGRWMQKLLGLLNSPSVSLRQFVNFI